MFRTYPEYHDNLRRVREDAKAMLPVIMNAFVRHDPDPYGHHGMTLEERLSAMQDEVERELEIW